ncbi:MAG: DUF2268 domain-containing protein [Anaerobacillus sp.]|uniref:DUF2268 domain-containing protein n=1 Tax=Anaerobacillus sp. TaxID=1872506 RepID=UPI00391C6AF6
MRKQNYEIFFLIIIILLFLGCERTVVETKVAEDGITIRSFSHTTSEVDQQFTIVSAYEGIEEYITQVRNDENSNLRAVFKETVIIPVWDACFRDGEYLELMMPYFNTVEGYDNLDHLEIQIGKMKSADLEEQIEEALLKSAQLLPGPDTTVCVLPRLSTVEFAGVNVGSGKITLLYDDRYISSNEELGGIVAHEYHHSVWTSRHYTGQPFYLLKYLIFEGRAEAFKHMLYPNAWLPSYSTNNEEEYWNKLNDFLTIDAYNPQFTNSVMFGGEGFPSYFGYALGFQIVQDFLENNPILTVEEWTALNPEELLERSGFEDRFD